MSHRPERKEKDCLNCGSIVQGRYCQTCGQQNVEPKEKFWELVTHFIYDLTHFDGNFFSTVKALLFRPGFLSREYIKGRRMRYLNPIRMYIFTSAFFFLFFFSVVNTEDSISTSVKNVTYKEVNRKIEKKLKGIEASLTEPELPLSVRKLLEDQVYKLKQDLDRLKTDTTNLSSLNFYKLDGVDLDPAPYNTVQQYDSIQATLPASKRHGWLPRKYHIRKLELSKKYGRDMRLILNKMFDKFLHSFPQILFVSLPLFALLLQMLYIRRRSNYYYVDHIIYSVHLYCAMFIFIFILMCLSRLADLPYLGWLAFLSVIVSFYLVWYIYKSMRKFYQQSRLKTILKFLILLFISSIVMSFLFAIFFIFSAFTI